MQNSGPSASEKIWLILLKLDQYTICNFYLFVTYYFQRAVKKVGFSSIATRSYSLVTIADVELSCRLFNIL